MGIRISPVKILKKTSPDALLFVFKPFLTFYGLLALEGILYFRIKINGHEASP